MNLFYRVKMFFKSQIARIFSLTNLAIGVSEQGTLQSGGRGKVSEKHRQLKEVPAGVV